MGGLAELTAAAHAVAIRGRTYRLSPLTLADYGEIENQIRAARPDPLAAIAEKLAGIDQRRQQEVLGQAFDQAAASAVTLADLDRWWQTPRAYGYRFWLMLRRDQPEMVLSDATELLRRSSAAERNVLGRRMEDCHALPKRDADAGEAFAGNREVVLPWHAWALQLSRAYGWTPNDIARLTIAQMWIYLSGAAAAGGKRRMSPADARVFCQQRRCQRQRWIERMIEGHRHAS
jgi:hypothetical protein